MNFVTKLIAIFIFLIVFDTDVLAQQLENQQQNTQNYSTLTVANKQIKLGDTEKYVRENFTNLVDVMKSSYGWEWNVFTTDYSDFIMIGIKDGFVEAICTNASTFKYKNITSNIPKSEVTETPIESYFFDGDKLDGIYLRRTYKIEKHEVKSLGLEIFYLTNSVRYKKGLQPYLHDNNLDVASVVHSKDMASNNFFGHDSPNGSNPLTRIMDTGIFVSKCSENIAKGYSDGVYAYEALLNSPSHRAPMLGKYTYQGVGAALDKDNTFYYTQLFSIPLK